MLKYHIQTSGRSLHEIDFNDIRTTLQALYAIYDNCNSLHTMRMMKQLQHLPRNRSSQWQFS
jgi:methylmalonyl-CoA mutase N-terminal domain/subunit